MYHCGTDGMFIFTAGAQWRTHLTKTPCTRGADHIWHIQLTPADDCSTRPMPSCCLDAAAARSYEDNSVGWKSLQRLSSPASCCCCSALSPARLPELPCSLQQPSSLPPPPHPITHSLTRIMPYRRMSSSTPPPFTPQAPHHHAPPHPAAAQQQQCDTQLHSHGVAQLGPTGAAICRQQ